MNSPAPLFLFSIHEYIAHVILYMVIAVFTWVEKVVQLNFLLKLMATFMLERHQGQIKYIVIVGQNGASCRGKKSGNTIQ